MNKSQEVLSKIVTYSKYAKYLPEKRRRETWDEIVDRNKRMHISKLKTEGFSLSEEDFTELDWVFEQVREKKVLPSMRSMQFAGRPLELNNIRMFNCAYMPMDDWRAFHETMFLLLSGTGVGIGVQKHMVEKLPEIQIPTKERRYLVGDSSEGWADAVQVLIKSYLGVTNSRPIFDFRAIREKGQELVTSGGKAPGPEPLQECLFQMEKILKRKKSGEKLTPLEVHDIVCHIADAVLSGGIRRAALISLFSVDDEEMMYCKTGDWWETNPQRGRANNSAVLVRHRITKEKFDEVWKIVKASRSGEPGIIFTNDKDLGVNPCCFVGETKVKTSGGSCTIQEIVEGMEQGKEFKVLSKNIETGVVEEKKVLAASLTKEDATVVDLEIEENGITYLVRCTPDHKFYTKNRGYVECKNLTEEDDVELFYEY